MDFLPHILIFNPEYLLSSLWVPVFSTTYLLPLRSEYLFTLHQMIGWENIRDCDITTPLSLDTIEVLKWKWHSTYPIGDELLRDQRGAASFRYRNRAEITVVMCELKLYPISFSCRHELSGINLGFWETAHLPLP